MRWQCALLQRWLPEYPDGDLPAFWKRRLGSHLAHCPTCRQELAAMQDVLEVIKASPPADPGPEFWGAFSRELHLKLAQTAQSAQEYQTSPEARGPRFLKIVYVLGVPTLAVLILWAVAYFRNPERPVLTPPPQVAQQGVPAQGAGTKTAAIPKPLTPPAPKVAQEPSPGSEEFSYVTLESNDVLPDDDTDWDLDSELSGMTPQEKERFLKKLYQQKKDGSWLKEFSSVLLA